jgi:hypothetical protein
LNHNKDADKLRVGVTGFVMMKSCFVIKYKDDVCCFLYNKKKEKEKEEMREERRREEKKSIIRL